MKDQNNHQEMKEILEELKDSPARDPGAIAKGRAAFLDEADRLSRQPVSISPFRRLINSLSLPQPRLRFSTLTIGIVLGVLLLTFSSSVYAARRSLPDQLLYPFKLWLENSRLSITQRPDAKINLRLDYAEERLTELEGYSDNLTDPAIAITIDNFDDQINAIEGLIETHGLKQSQRERLKRVEEEYHALYEDEETDEEEEQEEDSSSPEELEDETDEQSLTETEEDEQEESEDQAQEDDEPESEDTETETPEDDESAKETEEPDHEDDGESKKEDETLEPPTDEPDDSTDSEDEEESSDP